MTIPPQVARVREVFDDWARNGRAEGMERGHGPAARLAFDRLELSPGQRYLDVGCGNGYTVRWAAASDPTVIALGVDLSTEMVERARELSAELPNASFRQTAWPPPAPLGTFDAVFSMETFYYLPDLAAGLAAVHDALAPGGRFACVVDYYTENPESHGWPDALGVPMHLLDEAGWRRAFEGAGLAVVEQSRLRPQTAQIAQTPQGQEPGWKQEVGSLLTLGRRG